MSDYIKREDAIQAVKDNSYSLNDDELIEVNGFGAIDSINELPSADVVEVVRCKDCMYNDRGWCGSQEYGTRHVEDNDYCSYGERKDGKERKPFMINKGCYLEPTTDKNGIPCMTIRKVKEQKHE